MSNRKSVLIIHHGEGVGGALIALLGLIGELKASYDVSVFCIFDSNAVGYIKKTGVKVLRPKSAFFAKCYKIFIHSEAECYSVIDAMRKVFSFLAYAVNSRFFALNELKAISASFDVVYLNSVFLSDWAWSAKKLKKKVVLHVREPIARRMYGVFHKLIRAQIDNNCDWVIAITRDNAHRLGLEKKTSVVYDPVVIRTGNDATLDLCENFKYFVYMGGGSRIKGYEDMAESLQYLNEDVRILWLGDEPSRPRTRARHLVRFLLDASYRKSSRLADVVENSNRVIKLGLIDNVDTILRCSLALICPFLKPHAALPILEAFSTSRPVIVSNIEGMRELVDESTGFFYRVSSPQDLAARVNEISKLPQDQHQLFRINCRHRFETFKNNNHKVSRIISSILAG